MGVFLPKHRSWSHRRRVLSGSYIDKVLSYDPIAYWPLTEHSGTVAHCLVNGAQNGTYSSDVSAMGIGTGIGDGNDAPYFDGTNDYCNIYSATLNTVFNGATGTMMIWYKVNGAGVYTDGTARNSFSIYDGVQNYGKLYRSTADNRCDWMFEAGDGQAFVSDFPSSVITWIHGVMTWSDANNDDEMKGYKNAAQVGATSAALNAWAGDGLDPATCCIGAESTVPGKPWHGWLAHAAAWSRVLTATEIADLATV